MKLIVFFISMSSGKCSNYEHISITHMKMRKSFKLRTRHSKSNKHEDEQIVQIMNTL